MKIFASKLKSTYVLLLILVSIVSISLAVDFYLPPESLDSKDLSLSISKSLEGESFVDKNYITGDDGEHIYFVETEEELLPNPINSSTADDQDVGAVSWPTSSIADNSLTPIRYSEKPSFFEEDLDVGDNAESFTNQNESPSRINREIRAINPRIYTYSWPRCILESLNWMDEDEYSDREQMYDRKKKLNEKIMAQIRSEYPGMPKKALILAGGRLILIPNWLGLGRLL